jgi:hypothetical protein
MEPNDLAARPTGAVVIVVGEVLNGSSSTVSALTSLPLM